MSSVVAVEEESFRNPFTGQLNNQFTKPSLGTAATRRKR